MVGSCLGVSAAGFSDAGAVAADHRITGTLN
jgi:hypothetical protein